MVLEIFGNFAENKKEKELLSQVKKLRDLTKRIEDELKDLKLSSADQEKLLKEVLDTKPAEIEFELNSCKVVLSGYIHSDGLFGVYKSQIERLLDNAKVLIIETAHLAKGDSLGYKHFFEKIEELAWNKKVPHICNDIHEHVSNNPNDQRSLDAINERLKTIKFATLLGAISTLFLGVNDEMVSRLKTKMENKAISISRRTFITGAFATAAVNAMSLYGELGKKVDPKINPIFKRRTDELGFLKFDRDDFRDVYTAYTVYTLSKQLPVESKIALTYGAGHLPIIYHYLKNPTELILRMSIYKIVFGNAIPDSIVHVPRGEYFNNSKVEGNWTGILQENF